MMTIFGTTFKSAIRDPFLLLWSIVLPIGGTIGLGSFITKPGYPVQILTGMMAVSVLFYALMTSSFSILTQRRRGVYHLLKVTPMPLWEYIVSVSSAWTLVSFLCSMLVLVIGSLVFKISITMQSFIAMLPLIVIATLGYLFFSFFIASLSKNESNVSIISNLIVMPLLFGSSAFYVLETESSVLNMLVRLNPFEWFINGLRSAIKLSWPEYVINVSLVLGAAFVALLVAVNTFKYSDVN